MYDTPSCTGSFLPSDLDYKCVNYTFGQTLYDLITGLHFYSHVSLSPGAVALSSPADILLYELYLSRYPETLMNTLCTSDYYIFVQASAPSAQHQMQTLSNVIS